MFRDKIGYIGGPFFRRGPFLSGSVATTLPQPLPSSPYQGIINFNTVKTNCPTGMYLLIHPKGWINDERMAVHCSWSSPPPASVQIHSSVVLREPKCVYKHINPLNLEQVELQHNIHICIPKIRLSSCCWRSPWPEARSRPGSSARLPTSLGSNRSKECKTSVFASNSLCTYGALHWEWKTV